MKFYRIITHALLAVVLMYSTEGVPIALHYCSGEIESVRVFSFSSACEGDDCDETTNTEDGCCKNTVEIHQFTYDATVQNTITVTTQFLPDIVQLTCINQTEIISAPQIFVPTNQSGLVHPERRQSLLCTYRI